MFKEHLKKLSGDSNFISGVHNYCDRWCERCSLTSRCMNFALSEAQFADSEDRDIKNKKFWVKFGEMFQVTLGMLKEDAIKWGIDLDSIDFEKIAKKENEKKKMARANYSHMEALKKEKILQLRRNTK